MVERIHNEMAQVSTGLFVTAGMQGFKVAVFQSIADSVYNLQEQHCSEYGKLHMAIKAIKGQIGRLVPNYIQRSAWVCVVVIKISLSRTRVVRA